MKKILTIQDISCVGQCSLTVALPIISSFGIETAIIPTAVLSTHTAFPSWTFHDLTEEMPKIETKWAYLNITFDGFYTGYIGSVKQIEYIESIIHTCSNKEALVVVDPCMADNGKLYAGFDVSFPKEMFHLCQRADIIVPNLTEACLLLEIPYRDYDYEELKGIVIDLYQRTNAKVVLTGVRKTENEIGALFYDGKHMGYHSTEYLPFFFHGTGDCFASCFFGAMMSGHDFGDSTRIACQFTYLAIKNTQKDAKSHFYGVHFEEVLKYITTLKD